MLQSTRLWLLESASFTFGTRLWLGDPHTVIKLSGSASVRSSRFQYPQNFPVTQTCWSLSVRVFLWPRLQVHHGAAMAKYCAQTLLQSEFCGKAMRHGAFNTEHLRNGAIFPHSNAVLAHLWCAPRQQHACQQSVLQTWCVIAGSQRNELTHRGSIQNTLRAHLNITFTCSVHCSCTHYCKMHIQCRMWVCTLVQVVTRVPLHTRTTVETVRTWSTSLLALLVHKYGATCVNHVQEEMENYGAPCVHHVHQQWLCVLGVCKMLPVNVGPKMLIFEYDALFMGPHQIPRRLFLSRIPETLFYFQAIHSFVLIQKETLYWYVLIRDVW